MKRVMQEMSRYGLEKTNPIALACLPRGRRGIETRVGSRETPCGVTTSGAERAKRSQFWDTQIDGNCFSSKGLRRQPGRWGIGETKPISRARLGRRQGNGMCTRMPWNRRVETLTWRAYGRRLVTTLVGHRRAGDAAVGRRGQAASLQAAKNI